MFFLVDPTAVSVHVKVRTFKSYFSRDEHIGQVSIPTNCFMEGLEAQLCLPLEPTYRMEGSDFTYGEIHILTELVYVDPAELRAGREERPKLLRKRPLATLPVCVTVSLRDAEDPSAVWWPAKHFNGELHGAVLCSFSHLFVRLDAAVLDLYRDFSEFERGVLEVPWWQVLPLSPSAASTSLTKNYRD
jgi:hypothetical protein